MNIFDKIEKADIFHEAALKVALSQKVFHFCSNKKMVPNHSPDHFPPKKKMLRIDLTPFFGDLSQS